MNSEPIKVAIGIAGYRSVSHKWYTPLIQQVANFHKHGMELVKVISVGSMATDLSRNHIVEQFLETDAEYLAWIDDDNTQDISAIARLVQLNRDMATGVYVKRSEEQEAIMYIREGKKTLAIDNYTTGEILPIDSAGLGSCVVRRRVFERMKEEIVPLTFDNGGVTAVHEDDIVGDILDNDKNLDDGKVVNGVLQLRVRLHRDYSVFPWHVLQQGRTEDYFFFELAKKCGFQLWVDTGTIIGHIGEKTYKPGKKVHIG